MNKKKVPTVNIYIIGKDHYVNIDLDHSLPFDKRIIWSNELKNTPTQLFIEKRFEEIIKGSGTVHIELKKIAFNNMLCNLIWGLEQQKLIAIPLGKRAYNIPRMYGMNHYKYDNYKKILNWLTENRYVNIRKGFFDIIRGEGKVTRIWAAEKLNKEFNEISTHSYSIATDLTVNFSDDNVSISNEQFSRIFYDSPVILKDNSKRKNIISYKPTAATDEMTKFLNTYNNFISTQDIIYPSNGITKYKLNCNKLDDRLNATHPNLSFSPLLGQNSVGYTHNRKLDCKLYRVFNNGRFDEGGRFYGAEYQNLSEEERSNILINRNKVIEIDFSALHGRMVYQYCIKADCVGDPYLINGNMDLRKASKKMFQMMLNANSKVGAIKAFKKCLIGDQDGEEIKKIIERNMVTPDSIYQDLEIKHKNLQEYFATGIGIKLQYFDSIIAENILKYFTYKNIPCLCVHDSFIVEERYAEELADVMRSEYKKIIGFDCVLKNREGK